MELRLRTQHVSLGVRSPCQPWVFTSVVLLSCFSHTGQALDFCPSPQPCSSTSSLFQTQLHPSPCYPRSTDLLSIAVLMALLFSLDTAETNWEEGP